MDQGNPPPPQPPQLVPVEDTGTTAKVVYILYLVAFAVGVTSVVGVVMAYANQARAPVWIRTHYRFQVRTFWIGLLYCVVALLLTKLLVGLVLWPLIAIWYIVRCVKGLMAADRRRPYPNPASWLW